MAEGVRYELIEEEARRVFPHPSNPRDEYDRDHIRFLGESISEGGLLNLIVVEEVPREEVRRHYPEAELPEEGPFYFSVAGNNRNLAFLTQGYEVAKYRLARQLEEKDVFTLQVQEDSQVAYDAWRTAYEIREKWDRMTERGEEFTLSEFAGIVCKHPSTVRKALRYTRLQEEFREDVEVREALTYSEAVNLARLLPKDTSLDGLMRGADKIRKEQERLRNKYVRGGFDDPRTERKYINGAIDRVKKALNGESADMAYFLTPPPEGGSSGCGIVDPAREAAETLDNLVSVERTGLYTATFILDRKTRVGDRVLRHSIKTWADRFQTLDSELGDYADYRRGREGESGGRELFSYAEAREWALERGREDGEGGRVPLAHGGNYKDISLGDIVMDPENIRGNENITEGSVRGLAKSIDQIGLLHPVLLNKVDGKYQLIVGHRRYAAHQLLERDSIHAFVVQDLPRGVVRDIQIIEDSQKPLPPHRRAQHYERILELEYDGLEGVSREFVHEFMEDIGAVARDPDTVERSLILATLDPRISQLYERGKMNLEQIVQLKGLTLEQQQLVGSRAVLERDSDLEDLRSRITESNHMEGQSELVADSFIKSPEEVFRAKIKTGISQHAERFGQLTQGLEDRIVGFLEETRKSDYRATLRNLGRMSRHLWELVGDDHWLSRRAA